ncbi:MAG TPA: HD domain-containing phosphohydrolase [Gemmatimonadaceae bacterium]|nr:HD domain-containing phosphohydrolase [Gemmatimonadaceae bacterium]
MLQSSAVADDGARTDVRARMDAARDAERRGAWADAQCRYEEAFSLLSSARDAALCAEFFYRAGWAPYFQGDLEAADDAFSTSLAIAEANRQQALTAQARVGLAAVEFRRGHVAEAERLQLDARDVAHRAGDERLVAVLDTNLASIANLRGDVGTAIARYTSAIDRYRAIGDDVNRARALSNLARAHLLLAEWEEAEARLNESAALAAEEGDRLLSGIVQCIRGELLLKRGQLAEAKQWCQRASETLQDFGGQDWLVDVYRLFGAIYREEGEATRADAHLALALELAEGCGEPLRIGEVETERALLFLATDREAPALRALNRAYQAFADLGARREVADLRQRLDDVERISLVGAKEWAATVDRRDQYDSSHADDVARYASALARAVGVGGAELHWLTVGALLHDVGKSAVPVELLTKRGPLSATERALVRMHAAAGEELVAGLGFPRDVATVVRHHHERWNGAGYPDRLAGDRIPIGARIVAVASCWSSLIRPRSFRPALSRAEALRVMESEVGVATDPALFRVFRGLIEREDASRRAAPLLPRGDDGDEEFVPRLQRALGSRYQLLRQIARGGMSRVFLAAEPLLGREVVVKAIAPGPLNEESRLRFRQEMVVTARLRHPNILPVLSSGVRENVLYYVMPYVPGESLRDYIERVPAPPLDFAVRVVDELLDLLEYAHARGVVHRDIKPENVLLLESHAMLADFGVARVLTESRLTHSGVAVGTPSYMAPEQMLGDPATDARTDVYSLGLVAYELIAGRHPFADARSTIASRLVAAVPRLDAVRGDVPAAVASAIEKAMASEPHDRHQSAAEFRDALRGRAPHS